MKNQRPYIIGYLLFVATSPEASEACGFCVFGQTWTVFPAIISWSILAVGWFVSLAALSKRTDIPLPLIPKPSTAIGLTVAGTLIGTIFLGWITMLPFLIPCFLNLGLSITRGDSSLWDNGFRWAVRWTGMVALSAMLFFWIHDVRYASVMDEADKIMMWEGTVVESTLYYQLKETEPDSIDQYRKLVREANGFPLERATQRLAELGEAKCDVPILIAALGSDRSRNHFKNAFNSTDYGMERESIELALRKLTGLELAEQTSADEWKRRWNEVSGKAQASHDKTTE